MTIQLGAVYDPFVTHSKRVGPGGLGRPNPLTSIRPILIQPNQPAQQQKGCQRAKLGSGLSLHHPTYMQGRA